HEGFLYAVGNAADNGYAPAPTSRGVGINPYTSVALDIMDIVRQYHLTLAGDIVVYLRMLIMLGTLRYQLATDYDLAAVARRFFSQLIRQQGEAWLDPRLMAGRIYGASFRIKRVVELVEYLEEQKPLIAMLAGTAFGVQRRLQGIKRMAIALGLAVLAVGGVLYVTLADPERARSVTPSAIPFES